ncbi:alpha/beta-hydrolase [Lindgomyces ingoldianus]|uniref:Alpha/beta-hydrolase n=1 Tax=Lindgomyces ingoldianus TaxID=673940 RepID=A0ACB6Q9B2_9PLEO|nr:alpha/beta-hydrolase [Lindgomyces ingoldianus]KAF2463494.1 alpha/beta-hydrolase [Lindgomyces ingoldianus]
MSNTKTVRVPHLGGIDAAYQMPAPYDKSKPTLIMVNSFTTSSELYRDQYSNEDLTSKMNLIPIELLGHGQTRAENENWTYWDTAVMNVQVMDALGIQKAFVLGTSQGGWITVRMALVAPKRVGEFLTQWHQFLLLFPTDGKWILGIIPLGTSLDFESDRTRSLGCWNAPDLLTPTINEWTTNDQTTDFQPSDEYCNFLVDIGFGKNCSNDVRELWKKTIKGNYQGDYGRRRARMAAINLRDRDGLHNRLWDIRCPVLWLHVSVSIFSTYRPFL